MRILFIGNSHTYYNDMPTIFATLANANGHETAVDSVTKGGWILHNYLDVENEHSQKLRQLARQKHYDLCVLQEQSLVPVVEYETFADGVRHLIDTLKSCVDGFMLYQTFGWEDGHDQLAARGLTWDSMYQATFAAYEKLGAQLNIPVSPAGAHFARVHRERKEIPMFREDHVHATYAGSCLIALTHYHTIFGELPQNTAALDLSDDVIAYFLQIVGGETEK